jgi:hypothetical protein
MGDAGEDGATAHKEALSAYRALAEIGGLEPAGRDEDLVTMLIERLSPGAPDIETALDGKPVSALLGSMLSAIQPFTSMFRDILAFFERAKAQYGQAQWRLSVGEEFPELENFREFLDASSEIAIDFDAPAIDLLSAWRVLDIVNKDIAGWTAWSQALPELRNPTNLPDVDRWLGAYGEGYYMPFPESLRPEEFSEGWDDLARLILSVLHMLRETGTTRREILDAMSRPYSEAVPDIFDLRSLAAMELDGWLGKHARLLAGSTRFKPATTRATGAALHDFFSPFGRKNFSSKARIEDLRGILSLPAWKKRYEAYGVWVATRIVDAMEGHDIQIRHDRGNLPFAFKETILAEIGTARPPMVLFTERKVPLGSPVGKTRKSNAQPDFSVWTDEDYPRCVLVVEVKHYKKESRRNFGDALVDYAAAHLHADIVLVNYGPASDDYAALRGVKRATAIGHFAPGVPSTSDKFRKLVQEAVGHPVRVEKPELVLSRTEAIVIDVSGSMADVLTSTWLQRLLGFEPHATVHLVDHALRATLPAGEVSKWLSENGAGSSTSLITSLDGVLEEHASVLLVTDEDGAGSLSRLKVHPVEMEGVHPQVRLLRVQRTA